MDSMTFDKTTHLSARLDAASVQASVLDSVGSIGTLDFRNRPWIPGQPNRFAVGDRLVLDALTANLRCIAPRTTLAMLTSCQSGA